MGRFRPKEYLFCQNGVQKCNGLDLRAESPYKTLSSTPGGWQRAVGWERKRTFAPWLFMDIFRCNSPFGTKCVLLSNCFGLAKENLCYNSPLNRKSIKYLARFDNLKYLTSCGLTAAGNFRPRELNYLLQAPLLVSDIRLSPYVLLESWMFRSVSIRFSI